MSFSKEELEMIEHALEYLLAGESKDDKHFGKFFPVLHKVRVIKNKI